MVSASVTTLRTIRLAPRLPDCSCQVQFSEAGGVPRQIAKVPAVSGPSDSGAWARRVADGPEKEGTRRNRAIAVRTWSLVLHRVATCEAPYGICAGRKAICGEVVNIPQRGASTQSAAWRTAASAARRVLQGKLADARLDGFCHHFPGWPLFTFCLSPSTWLSLRPMDVRWYYCGDHWPRRTARAVKSTISITFSLNHSHMDFATDVATFNVASRGLQRSRPSALTLVFLVCLTLVTAWRLVLIKVGSGGFPPDFGLAAVPGADLFCRRFPSIDSFIAPGCPDFQVCRSL